MEQKREMAARMRSEHVEESVEGMVGEERERGREGVEVGERHMEISPMIGKGVLLGNGEERAPRR